MVIGLAILRCVDAHHGRQVNRTAQDSLLRRPAKLRKNQEGNALAENPRFELVPVERVYLDLENPRHGRLPDQARAIEYLCRSDQVLELAKDIVENGLNPVERFALIPHGPEKDPKGKVYVVAEGNRRLCAIKLLLDPELAPTEVRKQFRKISEIWTKIPKLDSAIFETREDAQLWLQRLHAGIQGGAGRRSWNADQKERSFSSGNASSLAVLDYAQRQNMISEEDRHRKLTTLQRFLSNPEFRDALGVDISNLPILARTRPQKDFDFLLHHVIADLMRGREGPVHSRAIAEEMEAYAQTLAKLPELSGERIEPTPLEMPDEAPPSAEGGEKPKAASGGGVDGPAPSGGEPKGPSTRGSRPSTPKPRQKLRGDKDLDAALRELNNFKLRSLYKSLCDIKLEGNTPLLTIGVWTFLETLTALNGRKSTTDFLGFLSPDRLQQLGCGGKKESAGLRTAIERTAAMGNVTKHD